jgi:predicted nucleic acid-binding protein
MALECKFFQSEIYTLDEKKCEQEITQQKSELVKQGRTVEAICVDIEIKLERIKDATDNKLLAT